MNIDHITSVSWVWRARLLSASSASSSYRPACRRCPGSRSPASSSPAATLTPAVPPTPAVLSIHAVPSIPAG